MVATDSKSEKFREKFTPLYDEALSQIDKLNKKYQLAQMVMEEVDKKSTVDQITKEMVKYEMAVRFNIEKHKVLDMLFAQQSPVLDLRDNAGRPVFCNDCQGKGFKTPCVACKGTGMAADNKPCMTCHGKGGPRCTGCGGIGRLVNHDLSLAYKHLFVMSDVSRALHAMLSGAGQQQPGSPEEMIAAIMPQLKPAFEKLYEADIKGKEAEEALRGVAQTFEFDEVSLNALIQSYTMFCTEKDVAKGIPVAPTPMPAVPEPEKK